MKYKLELIIKKKKNGKIMQLLFMIYLQAIIIVYDITNSATFSAVSSWYTKAISSEHYENIPAKIALFSNKCKYTPI